MELSSSSVVHGVPLRQVPRMKNEGVFFYIFCSLAALSVAPLIAALLFFFWKLILWFRKQVWSDGDDDDLHPLDPAKVHHHHRDSQGRVRQGADSNDRTDKEEAIMKY